MPFKLKPSIYWLEIYGPVKKPILFLPWESCIFYWYQLHCPFKDLIIKYKKNFKSIVLNVYQLDKCIIVNYIYRNRNV